MSPPLKFKQIKLTSDPGWSRNHSYIPKRWQHLTRYHSLAYWAREAPGAYTFHAPWVTKPIEAAAEAWCIDQFGQAWSRGALNSPWLFIRDKGLFLFADPKSAFALHMRWC